MNNEEQPICVPAAYRTLCFAMWTEAQNFAPISPHFPCLSPHPPHLWRMAKGAIFFGFWRAFFEFPISFGAFLKVHKSGGLRGMCVRLVDVPLLLKHAPFCVV